MRTFLLTHNPELWHMPDGEWLDDLEAVRAGASVPGGWSTGSRKDMDVGDRVYLLRQGPEPRGIIASGWTTSEPSPDEHWDDQGGEATYVDVEWDAMVPMDEPLPTSLLLTDVTQVPWNSLRAGGVEVKHAAAAARCQRRAGIDPLATDWN